MQSADIIRSCQNADFVASPVAACEPKLLRMDVLVTQLNETRDFYGFLKGVRREFEAFHGQR